MSDRSFDLTPAELEVLRTLWDKSPATVRDVLGDLHARGREVAYTTVQTLLTRLEQKGYVASDKTSLAFAYRPRLTRDRVVKSRMRSLVDQLFDGAAGSAVLHLVKSESLTPSDVKELQKLIDQLDGRRKRKPS